MTPKHGWVIAKTQPTQLNQANSKKKTPQLTVTNPATSIDANHFFKASGSSSAEASNKRPCSKSSPRFEVSVDINQGGRQNGINSPHLFSGKTASQKRLGDFFVGGTMAMLVFTGMV